ncbi:MAG: lactonase family protein [Tepidisphaeraceae bacterium]
MVFSLVCSFASMMFAQPNSTMDLYIGTSGKGVYRVAFDEQTGALGEPSLVTEMSGPSFLARHPSLSVLYTIGGGANGEVRAFTIASDGSLKPLGDAQPSQGRGPCHVSITPDGQMLFVANYGSGEVGVFPVNADGSIAPASAHFQHKGTGPVVSRQEGPHAHSVVPSPDGKFAIACDLGTDEVLTYIVNQQSAMLGPVAHADAGAGPRMSVWSPMRSEFYVANELNGTTSRYAFDASTGTAKQVQTISSLPDGFADLHAMSHVAPTPDGRFVYSSVRDMRKEAPWRDAIAIYAVDEKTGQLKSIGFQPTDRFPRHFAIDPTCRWMIVASQYQDTLRTYRLDATTGRLTPTDYVTRLGQPTCVLFPR